MSTDETDLGGNNASPDHYETDHCVTSPSISNKDTKLPHAMAGNDICLVHASINDRDMDLPYAMMNGDDICLVHASINDKDMDLPPVVDETNHLLVYSHEKDEDEILADVLNFYANPDNLVSNEQILKLYNPLEWAYLGLPIFKLWKHILEKTSSEEQTMMTLYRITIGSIHGVSVDDATLSMFKESIIRALDLFESGN